MFRAYIIDGHIELLMQINELRLPPNSRRVTYEITPDGNIVMVKTEGEKRENMLSQLFGKW